MTPIGSHAVVPEFKPRTWPGFSTIPGLILDLLRRGPKPLALLQCRNRFPRDDIQSGAKHSEVYIDISETITGKVMSVRF